MKKKLCRLFHPSQEGQSLVEMAIAVPLLIFLMIGVFEVGWALRGYLVLVNLNREATRWSVRPGYLDFGTEAKLTQSYKNVYSYTNQALSQQLPLDFNTTDGNATLIVSHVVVNTGVPCEDMKNCDCTKVKNDPNYNKLFKTDDLIIHPDMPGHEIQQVSFGRAAGIGPRESRIEFEELVETQLIPQDNYFNCEIMRKGGVPSDNNVVVTEFFYDQPQLFGFPLVSNPYTDPVPLYSHTVMRLIAGSRGDLTQNVNTIGPICVAYPFIIRDTKVPVSPGGNFDVLDGASPHGASGSANDEGFLSWNPNQTLSTDNLEAEISYPQLSVTDYTNANDASDHALSIGDYVKSLPGINGGVNDENDPRLDMIVGKEIVIPTWDTYNQTKSAYHIKRFIRVRLTGKEDDGGIALNSGSGTPKPPYILATYLGPADNCNNVN